MTNSTASGRWGAVRVVTGLTFLPARAKRNAAGRKRKALLIGINYNHAPDLELSFPQRDMRKMYALLKDNFGFRDEDIITLTDGLTEVGAGTPLPPTQKNIMREVRRFITRRRDNTDYVLFYSGHADQHEDESEKSIEVDGKKEFIMPMDTERDANGECTPNSVIYDTYLHEHIIKPLSKTKGCHLFAVFDCCHSATILNLVHDRCNRIGTLRSLARRVIRHCLVEDTPLYNMVFGKTTKSTECDGLCARVPNSSRNPTVVCLSACKDSESAIEHDTSDTLASAIVNLLQVKPQASIKDVVYAARDAVDQVHRAARDVCRTRWKHDPFLNLYAPPAEPLSPEAHLAQAIQRWNPQLSSIVPLDTNTTLMYSDVSTQKLDGQGRVRAKRPPLEILKHFTSTLSLPRVASSRRTGKL